MDLSQGRVPSLEALPEVVDDYRLPKAKPKRQGKDYMNCPKLSAYVSSLKQAKTILSLPVSQRKTTVPSTKRTIRKTSHSPNNTIQDKVMSENTITDGAQVLIADYLNRQNAPSAAVLST